MILRDSNLWKKILFGMVSGMFIGLLFHTDSRDFWNWFLEDSIPFLLWFRSKIIPWIALPGNLFLGLLQMIMIPLVISSVSLGIGSQSGSGNFKNLTIATLSYFIVTTSTAVGIGLLIVQLIQPGQSIDGDFLSNQIVIQSGNISDLDSKSIQGFPENTTSVATLIIQAFPKNPILSMQTESMLSIVIFSLLLGLAFGEMPTSSKETLVNFLTSIQDYTMVVVGWALRLAPLAVFGLMTQAMSQIGVNLLGALFLYILTVLLGMLLVITFYCLLLFFVTKSNPVKFLRNLQELQLLAFSSSSSAAVLPISLSTAQEKLGISKPVSDFVIPLGATINMNGTAIYQGIAAIFLAQIYQVDLTFTQLLILVAIVVGASIGTAATPGVGIVILAGILTGIGVPVEGTAIIFGVDRFLDMCRTAVNVTGDLVASKIMDTFFGRKLGILDSDQFPQKDLFQK